MKREFLKGLGITDDAVINSIMTENGEDINRLRAETVKARADLEEARSELAETAKELESYRESATDVTKLKQDLSDLQAKYDNDTAVLQAQITSRDYSDAVTAAITGAKLKFSSKGAESAFRAALTKADLPLKDGVLEGFEDFAKAQRSADPDSFVTGKPAPKFAGPVGQGGAPEEVPPNVRIAQAIGKAKAGKAQASADIFSMYSGGGQPGQNPGQT